MRCPAAVDPWLLWALPVWRILRVIWLLDRTFSIRTVLALLPSLPCYWIDPSSRFLFSGRVWVCSRSRIFTTRLVSFLLLRCFAKASGATQGWFEASLQTGLPDWATRVEVGSRHRDGLMERSLSTKVGISWWAKESVLDCTWTCGSWDEAGWACNLDLPGFAPVHVGPSLTCSQT
jgi:hypothetical protein